MAAVVAVQDRILTVGAAQYEEADGQKFELMSLQEIVQYAMEEVEDGIAYNVMLRYKLSNLKTALDASFSGYVANRASRHGKAPETPAPQPAPLPEPITAYVPVSYGRNPADILAGR